MTTGRINQVTVLHARNEPHEAAGPRNREAPSARPELVTDRSSRPSVARNRRTPRPLGRPVPQHREQEFLVPRSHTPQRRFPRSGGPESAPSVKTTVERPHLVRGLPERGVSPNGWLQTGFGPWAIKSTSLIITRNSGKGALQGLLFQALAGISHRPHKSQATVPSRAGTSCKAGASTARTRDGQPSPSGIHGHPPGRERGLAESTPVLPVVPAPPKRTRTPSHPFQGVSTLTTAGLQRRASARCTSSVSRSRPISRSQVTEQAQGLKLPSRRPSPIPAGRPPQANTRTPHQQRSQKTDTTGVLCTLSVLTLHVVGKYHFYQRLDWNVPGG